MAVSVAVVVMATGAVGVGQGILLRGGGLREEGNGRGSRQRHDASCYTRKGAAVISEPRAGAAILGALAPAG